jgi:hypothetical protein
MHLRKFCLSCFPFGPRKIGDEPNKTKTCTMCKKDFPHTQFFTRHGWISGKCRVCTMTYHRLRKQDLKKRAVEYKGGCCMLCGYNKNYAALDFHHRDPNQKEFTIRRASENFEKLKKELDKCDLVCANCHREIHCQERNMNWAGRESNPLCPYGPRIKSPLQSHSAHRPLKLSVLGLRLTL